METVGGDGSKTGLATKKNGSKNQRPVSVPASPRTTGIKTACIGASLASDNRDKEEINNNICVNRKLSHTFEI